MTRMNEVRTLLTGRGLVESPRWHGDRLYFSDWSAGEVVAIDLAGHSEVIAHVESLPLYTAWLPDGRLVIVSSPNGRLLRREPDGSLVTHADLGQPGWNDIVVDGRGNAYVNRGGFNPIAGEAFKPGLVALLTAALPGDGAMGLTRPDSRAAPPRHSLRQPLRHCLRARGAYPWLRCPSVSVLVMPLGGSGADRPSGALRAIDSTACPRSWADLRPASPAAAIGA
jgi:hypothetical protein